MDRDDKCQCKMGAPKFGHSVINFHFLLAKLVCFHFAAIFGSNHQQTSLSNWEKLVPLFRRGDLPSSTVLDFFVGHEVGALTISSIVTLFRWD